MGKGENFEREIPVDLSLWWSDGKRDDIFWRSSGSGSRAKTRAKTGKKTSNSYGDISYIDAIGEPLTAIFMFSLKRGYSKKKGKKVDPLAMIDSKQRTNLFEEWWIEAEEDRLNAQRPASIVIFQRDYMRSCVLISRIQLQPLISQSPIGFNSFSQLSFSIPTLHRGFVIMRYEHFFYWLSPNKIVEWANELPNRGLSFSEHP